MKRLLQRQGSGNCRWQGSFKDLWSHIKTKKCVVVSTGIRHLLLCLISPEKKRFFFFFFFFPSQMNLLQPGRSAHYNTLGDGPESSIFETNGLSEWRPSLLYSKEQEYTQLFPYLTTYRDGSQ